MADGDPQRGDRNFVRRKPERGVYEREAINAILDEGIICHLGFVAGHGPVVLPTLYGRLDDALYLHGSPAARSLQNARNGTDVCVTVTLLDGFVMARSLFHHSINYRSVVVFGRGQIVEERDEILRGLRAITENAIPGRWGEARLPTDDELRKTIVVKVSMDEVSAKVRSGPPSDDAEDMDLGVWAGVLPLRLVPGVPAPAPDLVDGIDVASSAVNYGRSP